MQNLTLDLKFGNSFIFVNKPAGISTHSPDTDRQGLAEIIESHLKESGAPSEPFERVFTVHRLDKGTTGALLFSTSENLTKKLFELFKDHQVKKKYELLTDARPSEIEFTAYSKIEKKGKEVINEPCEPAKANAETHFKLVKLNALYQRWEAYPKTGKPHQIRLHAKQLGIPILGDTLYGGSYFPHLCLHASDLEIPDIGKLSCFYPIFFERMGLIRDYDLAALLSSMDRRQRLFNFLSNPEQCLRLVHTEVPHLRIDQYGEVLWVYWFSEADPTSDDLERFEFLEGLLRKKILVRKMMNRGKDPNQKSTWSFSEIPKKWQAREGDLAFEMRLEQGLSPGLFLDQRQNRKWIRENSKDKSVLNLFSYTCGFSVAAAAGGAKEVVSVDLNQNFLEWGKENFRLNSLSLENTAFSFFRQDSIRFLMGAQKRNRKFDVIVCDPPSFSRNDKDIFRIEKELTPLLQLCFSCLNPGGQLLFCTNYEKWSDEKLAELISEGLGQQIKKLAQLPSGLDFELPGEPRIMKSFMITKK